MTALGGRKVFPGGRMTDHPKPVTMSIVVTHGHAVVTCEGCGEQLFDDEMPTPLERGDPFVTALAHHAEEAVHG